MNPWEEKEYGLVDEVIDDGKPGLVAPIGKINGRSRVAAKPGKIFHPSSRCHGMVMLEAKAMRTRSFTMDGHVQNRQRKESLSVNNDCSPLYDRGYAVSLASDWGNVEDRAASPSNLLNIYFVLSDIDADLSVCYSNNCLMVEITTAAMLLYGDCITVKQIFSV
ncbi:unnamed protein product [Amaranthus hypochondriacus]